MTEAQKLINFVLGFRGLNTSIDEFYMEDVFWTSDLPSNTSWDHISVASEEDMNAYIDAQNRFLEAAWTPNQTDDERVDNSHIMAEAKTEMNRLRKN